MAPGTTIIFVHGMFLTPLCWDEWLGWFSARGYRAWRRPGLITTGRSKDMRAAHPDPTLGRLTLTDIVTKIGGAIAGLEDTPVVIGHGMGGLIAQILVNRGVAAAGVAIHPFPPKGVFRTRWLLRHANWSLLSPLANPNAPLALSLEEFSAEFANACPSEIQKTLFETYVVPGSRRVARGARANVEGLDFARPHRPLLITAGVADRVIPATLNFDNFARYRQRGAITDFRAFDGRDHMTIVEPGWEEVADFVAYWLGKLRQ